MQDEQLRTGVQMAQVTRLAVLANDGAALATRLSSDSVRLQAAAASMIQVAATELTVQQTYIAAVDGMLARGPGGGGDARSSARTAAAEVASACTLVQQAQDGLVACTKQVRALATQLELNSEEVGAFSTARALALQDLQARKAQEVRMTRSQAHVS